MTSLGEIAPHVLIGLASRVHSSYLSTLSHTLIPLVPPPKSQ
jgi:hypothetical protein